MTLPITEKLLLTVMVLSFTSGLIAMVYDAAGNGVSDRARSVILFLYLWPTAVFGAWLLYTVLGMVWGFRP